MGGYKHPTTIAEFEAVHKIEYACEIEVPEGWKPGLDSFYKVRGTLLTMTDTFSKTFAPNPERN